MPYKKFNKFLLHVRKEVRLKFNPEKTKYSFVPRQNSGQNYNDIKIQHRSFENAATVKYMELTIKEAHE